MSKCLSEGVLQGFCDGELSVDEAQSVTSHLAHCAACSAMMAEMAGENELVSSALAAEFEAAVPTERLRQRIDSAVAGLSVAASSDRVSVLQRVNSWFAGLFSQPRALGYASLVVMLAFASVAGIVYFKQTPSVREQGIASDIANNTDKPSTPPQVTTPPSKVGDPQPAVTPVPVQQQRPVIRRVPRPISRDAVAKVKLLPGERSYLRTIADLDSTIKNASDLPMRPALRAEYERNLAVVDRALAAARTAAKKNPDDPDAAEFVYAAYQSKVDLMNTVADARVYNRPE